jgi:DNA polymerase-3 subunit epsilon
MIILGIDVETTGLDVETDEIVELGCVVYEAVYDPPHQQLLALHSDLYQTEKWSDEAQSVHQITREASQLGYDNQFNPWSLVKSYKPELIVAHNAEYDKGFVTKRWPEFAKLSWLCTDKDLPHGKFVRKVGSTRLQHLALDYGLTPNTTSKAHRALFDALLCCEMAAKHDLLELMKVINEPKYLIQAWHEGRPDFQNPGFQRHKEALKQASFRWDGAKWLRNGVPESQLEKYMRLATITPGWQATHTLIT